jgi:hypothetical protein
MLYCGRAALFLAAFPRVAEGVLTRTCYMCVPYYILLYVLVISQKVYMCPLVVSQKVYMCPILHTSICASSLAEGVLSRTCDIRCPRVLVVSQKVLY